jgi:hypothetical protein
MPDVWFGVWVLKIFVPFVPIVPNVPKYLVAGTCQVAPCSGIFYSLPNIFVGKSEGKKEKQTFNNIN